jgi:hypothetical protein
MLQTHWTAAFFSVWVVLFSVLNLSFLGLIGFFSPENIRSNSTDILQG